MLKELIGKHITLITLVPNQPIVPESTVTLFSGILRDIDDDLVKIGLNDGTSGYYYKDKIIGFVENQVVEESLSDINNSERVRNGEKEASC